MPRNHGLKFSFECRSIGMRRPIDAFEIEKDAQLLRARRAGKVQHMHALPAEHLASFDIAVDELNHACLPVGFFLTRTADINGTPDPRPIGPAMMNAQAS